MRDWRTELEFTEDARDLARDAIGNLEDFKAAFQKLYHAARGSTAEEEAWRRLCLLTFGDIPWGGNHR